MTEPLRAYVVADIEGSTGAWMKEDTLAGTTGWRRARLEMTRDISHVAKCLFESGAQSVLVKDFHRDGYNILPQTLDKRAQLVRGYFMEPLLMYGDIAESNRAFFVGMHAGSGNCEGFLPHTLTSRISELRIAGEPVCETQLFAHVLGGAGVPVVFVSGCPAACTEARQHLPWIVTCPVPKTQEALQDGDYHKNVRSLLEEKTRDAAALSGAKIYRIPPPYDCEITFRERRYAERGNKWGFKLKESTISFSTEDPGEMMLSLLKIAYFTPFTFGLVKRVLAPGRAIMQIFDRLR